MIFAAYSLLYRAALSAVLLSEYRKRPPHLRARWLKEKRGVIDRPSDAGGETIWIHAVSVGEVIAAVPLVRGLRERIPDLRIVLTTITDTGQKVARERFGESLQIVYMPFDLPGPLNHFLDTVQPKRFLIMETELWPNAIRICHTRGIPVALVNGRISERSYRGYSKMRFFMKAVFGRMNALCMQNEAYAERLRNLGARSGTVHATGNIKFDLVIPEKHLAWTGTLQNPTLIAGSTHNPEEALILDAYQAVVKKFPALNLVLAPRHPERFGEVEMLLKKTGLPYQKRSQMTPAKDPAASAGQIILLDVIGELSAAYAAADIAVMGGSFIPHGGQNPLEPAYWGKAILCGPHMFNFPFLDEFAEAGAIRRTTQESLADDIIALLSDPAKQASMGAAAKAFLADNSGATTRTLDILATLTPAHSS